ncbi:MAG: hypothetical protein ACHQY2_07460 [Candidatus Eremiobacterales bacterium]
MTPRFVALAAAIGVVYALSAFAPALAIAAIVAASVLIGLLAADAALGPRAATLTITRDELDHLALGVPASLRYEVANRGRTPAFYELFEDQPDVLQLPEAPACARGLQRRSAALPARRAQDGRARHA